LANPTTDQIVAPEILERLLTRGYQRQGRQRNNDVDLPDMSSTQVPDVLRLRLCSEKSHENQDEWIDVCARMAYATAMTDLLGGEPLVLYEWPKDVPEEQREWCRLFARAILYDTAPSPPELADLNMMQEFLGEVQRRIGNGNPELTEISNSIGVIRNWLTRRHRHESTS